MSFTIFPCRGRVFIQCLMSWRDAFCNSDMGITSLDVICEYTHIHTSCPPHVVTCTCAGFDMEEPIFFYWLSSFRFQVLPAAALPSSEKWMQPANLSTILSTGRGDITHPDRYSLPQMICHRECCKSKAAWLILHHPNVASGWPPGSEKRGSTSRGNDVLDGVTTFSLFLASKKKKVYFVRNKKDTFLFIHSFIFLFFSFK